MREVCQQKAKPGILTTKEHKEYRMSTIIEFVTSTRTAPQYCDKDALEKAEFIEKFSFAVGKKIPLRMLKTAKKDTLVLGKICSSGDIYPVERADCLFTMVVPFLTVSDMQVIFARSSIDTTTEYTPHIPPYTVYISLIHS
jgi:hypothetical protein